MRQFRRFSTTDFLTRQQSELVKIVDQKNVEVGVTNRKEMKEKKLWHRASYIYIITTESQGSKLLVQKRTMQKDFFPGFYDLSTGGVVGAGEDDDESAVREVEEELGIPDARLEKISVTKFEDDVGRVFANVYLMRDFDPDVTQIIKQDDEVEEIMYWSRAEIDAMLADGGALKHMIKPASAVIYQDLVNNKFI